MDMMTSNSNNSENKNIDRQISAALSQSIGELSPNFMQAFQSKLKKEKPYVFIKGTSDSIWMLVVIGIVTVTGITLMSVYSGDLSFFTSAWSQDWMAYSGYIALGFALLALYHLMSLYEFTQLKKKVLLKS
ncbi:MAG: hypothetical protein SchgKO_08660 [Schleiferiaceae bacterium]